MTGFRIDGHTIKRGKLICTSVIECHSSDLTLRALLESSGMVKRVLTIENILEKDNTRAHMLGHNGVSTWK